MIRAATKYWSSSSASPVPKLSITRRTASGSVKEIIAVSTSARMAAIISPR